MRHLVLVLAASAAFGAARAGEPEAPLNPAPPKEARKPDAEPRKPAGDESRAEQLQARVARLVDQLGDEDYRKREAAGIELTGIGDEALPALRAACAHLDLEIADRARRLVAAIEKNPRRLAAREGWESAGWDNPAEVAAETEPDSGRKVLLVRIPGEGQHGKSTVKLGLDDAARARAGEAKSLELSVRHDAKEAVPVSVAFLTEADAETVYFETPARKVAAGEWQKLSFDLGAEDFKCPATDWAYKSPLKGRKAIKSVLVVVEANRKLDLRFTGLEFRK
jgi:hypothetical protein